jgi:hypothetical protein
MLKPERMIWDREKAMAPIRELKVVEGRLHRPRDGLVRLLEATGLAASGVSPQARFLVDGQ